MDKQKARQWALELSGRQGPCSLAIHRTAFELAGSQAERHQLLNLTQQARDDDKALGQLTEWIQRAKKPVALSEQIDSEAWVHALTTACQLAGRCRRLTRASEAFMEADVFEGRDVATKEKLKVLADSARTDEESLKQLARALYSLSTGDAEAPSLSQVKNVLLWIKALQSTYKLASLDRQKAAKRLKNLFPNLPSTKLTGLLDVVDSAGESAQAYDLLSVEIYRLLEEKHPPIEVPEGFHDITTVQLSELAHSWVGRMRGLRAESKRLHEHISALEKRLPKS